MKVSVCSKRPILVPCGLKTHDYQVDPYVGCEHCCYYCYVLGDAETDWSEEIRIHEDIIGQLSTEMEGIPPQAIYMGYHTDPYQPCESEQRQTEKTLTFLKERGFSASVLSKSDLVTRDIGLLREMENPGVSVSVAFNDNETRRLFEGNTIDTERRIDALAKLKEAGIRTGALVCPVIPYVTDALQLIDSLRPHTDVIWIYGLSISDRTDRNWRNIEPILKTHFPDSFEQIEDAIFSKEHGYWTTLRKALELLKKDQGLNLNIHV